MIVVIACLLLIFLGFGVYYLTDLFPVFQLLYMDYMALVIMVLPTIILIYFIVSKRLLWFIQRVPPGKLLLLFLRRDGTIIPVLGNRPYTGESFIDVHNLGIFHDIGRGSVYRWGQNNVRFALENVNHTVDPKWVNYTSWLYSIGLNDYMEIKTNNYDPETIEETKLEIEKVEKDRHQEIVDLLDEGIETCNSKPPPEKEKKKSSMAAQVWKKSLRPRLLGRH